MTIAEAMSAASDEYNTEAYQAQASPVFNQLMMARIHAEYQEIDKELPEYIAEIAHGMGIKQGEVLPEYVYVACRMSFRFGMRVQRKMDHPERETTVFWQGDPCAH